MFTDVLENVSVATPVLKPSVPPSVPTRLAVPAGATWKKFNVKFPPTAGPSKLAGTVVVTTRSPKLVPAGVFTGFVVPLKVIVVVPWTLVKLTTFVPLMLKTPVVLKVTGSALASPATMPNIAVSRTPIRVVLNRRLIGLFSLFNSHPQVLTSELAQWHPQVKGLVFPHLRWQSRCGNTFIDQLLLSKTPPEISRRSEKTRSRVRTPGEQIKSCQGLGFESDAEQCTLKHTSQRNSL